jgi:hypothetical protein
MYATAMSDLAPDNPVSKNDGLLGVPWGAVGMSLLLGKHGLCPAGLRPKQSFEWPVCGIGDRQQLAELGSMASFESQ